ALAGARLALPEVNLGLLPGAGGTQRTPRLIGAAAALDIMLSGRHASAKEALEWGPVDRIAAEPEAPAAGRAEAQGLLPQGGGPRPTRDATALQDRAAAQAAIDAARTQLQSRQRSLFSPSRIVDAVQAALDQPFDSGLQTERALF